jgi:hypothetical protein
VQIAPAFFMGARWIIAQLIQTAAIDYWDFGILFGGFQGTISKLRGRPSLHV